MRDSKLSAPAIDDACSNGLKKRAQNLAGQTEKLNADWVALGDAVLGAQQAPAEDFDMELSSELTRREVELLRREIAIRLEVKGVIDDGRRELQQLAEVAFSDHEKAKESIAKKLVKFGFHEKVAGVVDPCTMTPDMIHRHPQVFESLGRMRELKAAVSNSGTLDANASGMALCRKRLEAIKQRVLMMS